MLLEKFSEIIDRSGIGASVADRQRLIESTNPRRIFVENIRSFFHLPYGVAKGLLDLAVRVGELEKRVAFLCPNCQKTIGDFSPEDAQVEALNCIDCEINEEDRHSFAPSDCQRIEYYRIPHV